MSVCIVLGACSNNQNETEEAEESSKFLVEDIDKVNGDYQLSKTFPLQIDEDGFDSSLVTNQMVSFTGFENQGMLLVKSNDFQAHEIFINGIQVIPNSEIATDSWSSIDISHITVNGDNKLQVTNGSAEADDTIEIRIPYPTLVDQTNAYTDNDNFKMIDQIIQSEIDNGFTSAQLVVTHNGEIIKSSAYGNVNAYEPDGTRMTDSAEVTENTLYDLASNTKMYSVNYAIQKLVSEEKLDINQKIHEIFPDFKDGKDDPIKGKKDVIVKDLLQHQAGFPGSYHYHNKDFIFEIDEEPFFEENELYTQDRDEMLEMILKTPLVREPGTEKEYSDIDYMLLTFIIEEVTGKRLDEYLEEEIYGPLGLENTTFNPLENGFDKDQITATELNGNTRDGLVEFDNIRTETIQGEVHDEKAYYSMNGISGHAGLFSTANDLAVLAQVTLNKGGYGDQKFFNENVIDEFITPKDDNPSYGLGWRRKGEDTYDFAFSPISSSSTIGHTGWTGTLTVIDPENNMAFILLTNKKNSPVVDKEENPNDFVGDHFLTSHYGLIATLAFDSVEENADANDYALIDMVETKYSLINEGDNYDHESDHMQLQAMVDVLEMRKDSTPIKEYMETEKWETIQQFLSE
ncbi:MAG TPA: penicillin binding protein PBP4B [Bacillota bacterium]|nr:penicillin binding protein PBP4B [Bacillota bacterium]